MQAKMEVRGLLDPKLGFPQTNAEDLMAYREVFDLDYVMPMAHALEEACRPVVEDMIHHGGAKAKQQNIPLRLVRYGFRCPRLLYQRQLS